MNVQTIKAALRNTIELEVPHAHFIDASGTVIVGPNGQPWNLIHPNDYQKAVDWLRSQGFRRGRYGKVGKSTVSYEPTFIKSGFTAVIYTYKIDDVLIGHFTRFYVATR